MNKYEKWKTNLSVFFFQKMDDSNVVFENDNMGPREGLKHWHVRPGCRKRPKKVFRKRDSIQLS